MKHKLLQTWARKSAKLLALTILCAFGTLSGFADATVGDNYTKVTNVNELTEGGEYILTYESAAMGALSGKYFLYVADGIAINGNNATINKAGVQTFDVVTGTVANTYAFKLNLAEGKTAYMTCTKASNNNMGSSETLIANANMKISIAENGVATIIPNSNSNKDQCKIQCNTNSGQQRFSNYNTGTQNNCTIYKKVAADSNQPAAPKFNPNGGEVDANSTVTITGDEKTKSLKYWFNDDQANAITAEGITVTVTITEACTLKAIAIGEGGVESGVKAADFTLTPPINTYKKITNELTSGKYVFMCGENFVNPALPGQYQNRCDFTNDFSKTGDVITASAKYEFTINIDGEQVTIQGPDGQYMGVASETATAFNLYVSAGLNSKYTFSVTDGVVKFASANQAGRVLAQQMNGNSLYTNFAPGPGAEGSVYPTLYKLYVAPAAPELPAPTVEEGVVTEAEGGWRISPKSYPCDLTFNVAEGVQMYAKQVSAGQANAAAEGDNDGYTVLEGNKLKLTTTGEVYSVYAMKDGVKSETKTVTADVPSGIAAIEAENGEAVYFNLQGVRVENPENGIFIRVQNGKAVKVMK